MTPQTCSLQRIRIASITCVSIAAVFYWPVAPRGVVAKDLFQPSHVAKLKSVASASISPDGKLIAYALAVPRDPFHDENGPARVELHVVDADGNSRPFVTTDDRVGQVQWTPDGKGIAFLAKRVDDKHTSLYVVPVDGGEARRVLAHKADVHD